MLITITLVHFIIGSREITLKKQQMFPINFTTQNSHNQCTYSMLYRILLKVSQSEYTDDVHANFPYTVGNNIKVNSNILTVDSNKKVSSNTLTVGSNKKVSSNTLTVGSNMILMVGGNEIRDIYIVRIRKLTAKPHVRECKFIFHSLVDACVYS